MIHPSEPVLSAAAAAVLLTFAAASAAAMTPGVYSAAVPARNGELAVEVQVSADRIESVKVVRQQETPGIGSLAVEALPAAIVAQQTSSVDVVSGATMTSNAIIKAKRLSRPAPTRLSLKRKPTPSLQTKRCRWKHKLMSSLWAAAEPAWWLQPPPSSAAPR